MITGSGLRAQDEADIGRAEPGWLARQVQALFAEARRRRRRKRLKIAAALLGSAALAGAAVIGYQVTGQQRPDAGRPGDPGAGRPPHLALPAALVAWFDGYGVLRVGNVATLAHRQVAHLSQAPCCRLITAGQKIYWAGRSGGRDYVQEYDPATRAVRNVAPGWAVIASASGRNVDIAQSGSRLLVLPAGRSGPPRRLVTPPGWHVVPLPWAVAGGIMLSTDARRPAIGMWRPGAGRVRVIGHGRVMATWTRPSGRGSLIAWQSAACRQLSCPIEITSTSADRTLTVHSPRGQGFLGQGGDAAFSPDGRTLAAFVNPRQPAAESFVPALVDTATGTVRLANRAVMANGEMAGWLTWLPGGGHLLAGPAADISRSAGYVIDARTAAARPFTFFPGSSYPANSSSDITYGAVVVWPAAVPARHAERQARPASP